MKKGLLGLVCIVFAAGLAGCGAGEQEIQDVTVTVESIEMEAGTQASEAGEKPDGESGETGQSGEVFVLGVPEVKDGVTVPAIDAVEVRFDWAPVEGADGYEVAASSKYYEDADYSEYERVETSETKYTAGAQDYYDFSIRVRAFAGAAGSRTYGEWSSPAIGHAYDPRDLRDRDSEKTAGLDPLYRELVDAVAHANGDNMDPEEHYDLDVSSIFFMPPYDEIRGYLTMDLDGDGTEELLLGVNAADGSGPEENGWDSVIYDVFTIQGGKLVHVFDGWERKRYYLCDNGLIANEGSSGASYSTWAYYLYSGGKLNIVETVYTDWSEVDMQGHWYLSNREPYEDETNEITEADAEAVIAKYTYRKLNFTAFE